MGLATMAHRVAAVGGKLTITSKPGATRLEARVPLDCLPLNAHE